jgi:hypothetical protein
MVDGRTEPADGTPLSGSEGAVTFLGGATPHTAGSQELLYLHFLQFFFFREGVVCIFARQALINHIFEEGWLSDSGRPSSKDTPAKSSSCEVRGRSVVKILITNIFAKSSGKKKTQQNL